MNEPAHPFPMPSYCGSALSVLLWLGCTSCAPSKIELDLPPIVAEGRRVALGTDLDIEICSGTLAKLDTHVDEVEAVLGLDPRPGKIPIYVLPNLEAVEDICSSHMENVSGCYVPSDLGGPAVIVSAQEFNSVYHEIVHDLVINSEVGRTAKFVEEGIAAALGTDGCETPPEIPLGEILDNFEGSQFDGWDIRRAGRFVRHILGQYGPELLIDWAKRLGEKADAPEVEEAFAETYGHTLEQEWQECGGGEEYPDPTRCLASLIEWEGDAWTHGFTSDCSDPTVNTDFADASRHNDEVVIEFPYDGDYSAVFSGPQPHRVWMRDCTSCSSDGTIGQPIDGEGSWLLQMSAGYKVLSRVADAQDSDSLLLDVRPFDAGL